MRVLYGVCCGLDVHKKVITAALLSGADKAEVREYPTTTSALKQMVDWLKESGCEHVAMESTGVYWKPVYNIFELEGIPAMVVNASHMKAIPGRKTDVNDAEWIADLLKHGLLRASFIPEKDQREYRELVRYRGSRTEERAREINRLQKMLEGMNIKLGDFVASIMGKSAGKLLGLALSNEELTDEQIEEASHPRLKASVDELKEALNGIITPLQRDLVSLVLDVIAEQAQQIAKVEALIRKYTKEAYREAAKKLETLPGIGTKSAQAIIAEIGVDMSRFPSANHLCSWAGVVPGNNESAGKRKNSKSRKGNRHLKKTLTQCATSAVKNKSCFFHAQYQRLVVRKGSNKATIAVAHTMLIAIYHVLSGATFNDLGADYYTQFNKEKKIQSHLKQLKKLGWMPPEAKTA
jgi:transposase